MIVYHSLKKYQEFWLRGYVAYCNLKFSEMSSTSEKIIPFSCSGNS